MLPAVVALLDANDKEYVPPRVPDVIVEIDRFPEAPEPKVGVPVGRPFVNVPMVPNDQPVVVPF